MFVTEDMKQSREQNAPEVEALCLFPRASLTVPQGVVYCASFICVLTGSL